MTDQKPVSYQEIEEAFTTPKDVITRLPESTETRRAVDHLKLAERYTMEARERVRPERTEAAAPPAGE